tara:strand:- start:139 stop:876 length:738 start_codon:yes stop_codon:yes gene_type:complete
MGGLGNQLFQWAASQSAKVKHNTECYYEIDYFTQKHGWKFELLEFNIEEPKVLEQNLFALPVVGDNFRHKELPDNCFLHGYWQSEKYFEEIKENIKKQLEMSEEKKYDILNLYPFMKDETISLHVRRGDYLKASHVHPCQTLGYYDKAVDLTRKSDTNILIFSDDIEWCKENFKYPNIHFSQNQTNITDLYAMSLCSHNIIANSSFSWWGAWLNNNPSKRVVAPSNWFADGTHSGDIVPEGWTAI